MNSQIYSKRALNFIFKSAQMFEAISDARVSEGDKFVGFITSPNNFYLFSKVPYKKNTQYFSITPSK